MKFGGDFSKGVCYDKDVLFGMVYGGCGFFFLVSKYNECFDENFKVVYILWY